MRVQLNTRIHPMGEVTFNPTARRGDPEWRVMYIGCGDSGSGESTIGNALESRSGWTRWSERSCASSRT